MYHKNIRYIKDRFKLFLMDKQLMGSVLINTNWNTRDLNAFLISNNPFYYLTDMFNWEDSPERAVFWQDQNTLWQNILGEINLSTKKHHEQTTVNKEYKSIW